MTITRHIRNHTFGIKPTLVDLQFSEWSTKFERLMRNRLIVGAFRYGRLNEVGKPKYDRCEYIKRKIDEYIQTGNLECLVDVSNLALCEFVEGSHPKKHFATKVDHNEHAKEIK